MSGLEIAGAVFGILSILVEVVKSYSKVAGALHTFRHYSKEVKSVRIQFRCHEGIFLNECRLLLRLVEDERGVKDMLDDDTDDRWSSKELNDKLNEVLKDSFGLCRDIIEASREIADKMREELKQFDILVEGKEQNESLRSTIRRLKKAARIVFDKSKFEQNFARLRDCTSQLTQVRAQIGAFQQQQTCVGEICSSLKIFPAHINNIRSASQKLHEALSDAWCCGELEHGHHFAKICLDAEVQDRNGVRLDLTISCQEALQQQSIELLPDPPVPIWLCVQSVSIDETSYSITQPESTEKSDGITQDMTSSTSNTSKKKASWDLTQGSPCKKKMRKRVRFAESSPDPEVDLYADMSANNASIAIDQMVARQTSDGINLCQTKNLCHYLKQNVQRCGKSVGNHPLGYLISPQMYRHNFYLQNTDHFLTQDSKELSVKPVQMTLVSIFDIMGQDVNDTLTMVDQIKLAHKTALAVLQFNDTPWLIDRWRLKDFSYFGSGSTLDEEALKTLHLSSQISSADRTDVTTMEGVEEIVAAYTEEDLYGINSTPLFFLGVALLELANWKTLEDMRIEKDPNEIVTARRLAARPSPLGTKYQEIARKCLQCNFGFGTDLKKKELQAAVYGDVVCQLERMIKVLSV
ncbi:hypothetical protein K504DRAFT_382260 [Pleomassaria siparia CBS 279.74]|uniref:Uncharacterized protein n=1 Tax=Pleomassaria siparia CBS 279.74 TaxID=1314801 RepID=A0A6G1K7K9_9PLEO|nr:hypothetical protein K504DRAFT_382260 [Pleomassaria siparia CBS 279.74]